MIVIMALLALLAGIMFAVQGPVNTAIGRLTNTFQATFISFFGGTLLTLAIVLAAGSGKLGLITTVRPWQCIGGLFGLVGVSVTVLCIPKLGAGLTLMAIMLGQLIMSAVIDGCGMFGTDKIAVSPERIAGILLVTAGIFLVYLGNAEPAKEGEKQQNTRETALFLVIAFVSGLITGMQSPINASLAAIIGNWEGTLVSFIVGTVAALILTLILNKGKFLPIKGTGAKPWMLCGGFLGVIGIFLNLYTVFALGAALQVACGMVGQLGGGILIDSLGLILTPKRKIDKFRAIGVAVIAAGVVLVTLARI